MDTFGGWLGASLKKDADGALTSMTDSITFLRLRQAVTRAELKTSLEGSLENGDFGAAQVGDAVDMDNAFVEHAQSPVAGVSGTVYSLSVQAKSDLSRMLPFWTDPAALLLRERQRAVEDICAYVRGWEKKKTGLERPVFLKRWPFRSPGRRSGSWRDPGGGSPCLPRGRRTGEERAPRSGCWACSPRGGSLLPGAR